MSSGDESSRVRHPVVSAFWDRFGYEPEIRMNGMDFYAYASETREVFLVTTNRKGEVVFEPAGEY
jgi:hypothetical protein|tara:strand:+ start:7914 stop:8108 length:195 start_codon:yes stop_codon:yes gene_type:complete